MYSLIRQLSARRVLLEQAPALAVAMVVAEILYKFGSFTLECLAFLATWYVTDLVIHTVARWVAARTVHAG